MLPLTITASAIIIVGFIAFLVNFRLLMYPLIPRLNPAVHAKRLRLTGSTLFISDLHLKSNRPFNYSKDLHNFIETNNVSNLVINGDLFDSPKDAQEALGSSPSMSSASKMLGLEGLSVNLFWVIGSPHHDPTGSSNNLTSSGGLQVLGRCAFIDCGHFEVLAYHGHDMSLVGAFGHGWDRFVSGLGLERMWKRLARIDQTVWVIFGHTHIPGVDIRSRVANCGGWQSVPFVRLSMTGIVVSEQEDAPKLVRVA
jgi:predicted phosphodiesterase